MSSERSPCRHYGPSLQKPNKKLKLLVSLQKHLGSEKDIHSALSKPVAALSTHDRAETAENIARLPRSWSRQIFWREGLK